MDPIVRISEELAVKSWQVAAAAKLLDEGATVPFIARYRKEVTGTLDDTQLRTLEVRLIYLRELEARREQVLETIAGQGLLSPELAASIREAETKQSLEDLYLPYKPKRRTRGQMAREAGLEPLALSLLENNGLDPEREALNYLNPEKGIETVVKALEGARYILVEKWAENPRTVSSLRETVWQEGILEARIIAGKEQAGSKFQDYFDYQEPIRLLPSHRALALFRARNEEILNLELLPGKDVESAHARAYAQIAREEGLVFSGNPADSWLEGCVRIAFKGKILTRITLDLLERLREMAEAEAIRVFALNLKDLLLQAPAGQRTTLGLDPGLRTGVKLAVVAGTGKLLDTATIYPHPPKNDRETSLRVLEELVTRHNVELLAIGNGTASRETDDLVGQLMRRMTDRRLIRVIVSEAGASVYSASALAADEFPDLDVSLRGAVSIARRLQDPLSELVKIDPRSIGVGQYQHDVSQSQLARSLDSVVEDCVNAVGVDVNTASASLLRHVSGLSASLGENLVAHRDQHGPFLNREDLLKIPRLGERTFQQAAGFLRIQGGDNPLDASAVHPESYPVVERLVARTGQDVRHLIGNAALLRSVNAEVLVDDEVGLPTVIDILKELEKPGRDPRPAFHAAAFREDISELQHLKPGMRLEGVVTNVANFGAFVDLGVHQDGLLHVSELGEQFISDPREVVKVGQVLTVRVIEVDVSRKRISLSLRSKSDERPSRRTDYDKRAPSGKAEAKAQGPARHPKVVEPSRGAIAEAFQRARQK